MKREKLYVPLAGCALFALVFYASYRYFLPERPLDAAMESRSAPARATDAFPVAAPAPVPAIPAAPGTVPPVAAEPAQRSPALQQDRDEDEAHMGKRRIHSQEALSRRKVVLGHRKRKEAED